MVEFCLGPKLFWYGLVSLCLVTSLIISYGNVDQWWSSPAMVANVELADVVVRRLQNTPYLYIHQVIKTYTIVRKLLAPDICMLRNQSILA